MRHFALLLALAGLTAVGRAQSAPRRVAVPVQDVTLSAGSPFYHAQQLDIRYLLGLDPDRLLAPYLKAAGLEPKAPNYTNWENTGLDGHIGGHYLSALSYMYAATDNDEIEDRLDYMLSELRRAQDAAGDGFLCGDPHGEALWREIKEGNIRAQTFGLNGGWVPLYNIHKTFNGLYDAYAVAGKEEARTMLVRLTDWMIGITSGLTDGQIQDMLRSEHGGLNEAFANVYALTGEPKYLELAKRFSHRTILEPLLQHEDRLTGIHANTQIPKVIGFKRIADVGGDAAWSDAAAFFWQTVVDHRSITIGGNSVYEHFHNDKDFSPMMQSEQGPETCNTYNMLRLSKLLWQSSGDVRYVDYYERALTNHILSTVDPVQGGFVYFTPMRSGHYRVYSQPQTSMWCCVGSGMENHARYGEMIYSTAPASDAAPALFVNLFIPSTLRWQGLRIEQLTRFPEEEGTTLVVRGAKAEGKKKKAAVGRDFALCIRVPEWTDAQGVALSVNGEAVPLEVVDGYARVSRRWQEGDSLHVSLPMSLRAVQLPDGSPYWSFLYGPVVLAAEMGRQDQAGLFADDSRGGHIAAGRKLPLNEMPVIVASSRANIINNIKKTDGKPLTFGLTTDRGTQQLGPFYRLYECRYMVYWNVVSPEELAAQQAELARLEQERQALELRTLDKVTCGEQQPESDHFIQMERSQGGDDNGRHWRLAETGGHFGYTLRAGVAAPKAGKAAKAAPTVTLRIDYRATKDAAARLLIDGTEVGRFPEPDAAGGPERQAEFAVPAASAAAATLEVRLEPAAEAKETPRIYGLRLFRE